MNETAIGVVFGSLLASSLGAQQWTVTGTIVTGFAGANDGVYSGSTTFPVGPVAPGICGTATGGSAWAGASWGLTSSAGSPAGFHVEANASVPGGLAPCFAMAGITIVVHLAHNSGQPVAGSLLLNGRAGVDVGNDGSWELAPASSAPGNATVPVVVPAGGLDVQVLIAAAATSFVGGFGQTDSASLLCQFVPGHTYMGPYTLMGTNADRLTATPLGNERWQLDVSWPGMMPLATIFGTQSTYVPITPVLVQLSSLDVWLPGTSILLDLPPLPAGSEIFAQAVLIDPSGVLVSTNSLRAAYQ